jgi:type II secretory pathway component PulJ
MNRSGVILLEVLIALIIISTAAASAVGFVTSAARDQTVLAEREAEGGGAERTLIAMALLTRLELERRLGERVVGPYVVEVDRPEMDLFRIGVSLQAAPGRELVATVVYRPI